MAAVNCVVVIIIWLGVALVTAAGCDDSAAEAVSTFVSAVERGRTDEVQRLRQTLVAGDAGVASALGSALKTKSGQGVQAEVSSVLAEMRNDAASTALEGALVDDAGRVRWEAAAALDRRKGQVTLAPDRRSALMEAISTAAPDRACVAIGVLSRDVELDVKAVVTRVVTRLRTDRADQAPRDHLRPLGDGALLVERAAAALSGVGSAAATSARELQNGKDSVGGWTERGTQLVTVFRALLGDTSTKQELLALAADARIDADTRMLGLRAIPDLCGEEGRPVLERVAASVPPRDPKLPPPRVVSSDERIASVARRAIERLDASASRKQRSEGEK